MTCPNCRHCAACGARNDGEGYIVIPSDKWPLIDKGGGMQFDAAMVYLDAADAESAAKERAAYYGPTTVVQVAWYNEYRRAVQS